MRRDIAQYAGDNADLALAEKEPIRDHNQRLALDEIRRLGGLGQQLVVSTSSLCLDDYKVRFILVLWSYEASLI